MRKITAGALCAAVDCRRRCCRRRYRHGLDLNLGLEEGGVDGLSGRRLRVDDGCVDGLSGCWLRVEDGGVDGLSGRCLRVDDGGIDSLGWRAGVVGSDGLSNGLVDRLRW